MDIKDTFAEAFSEAERQLKRIELLVLSTIAKVPISEEDARGVLFPAINELRYAGYHASRAFRADSAEAENSAYGAAIKHCHRASYDAIEAGLQFCLRECRTFRRDYRLVTIAPIVPGYAADCVRLNKIVAVLKEPRDKDTYYKNAEEHLDGLAEIVERWNSHREDLNKALSDAIRSRVIFVLAILMAILTVIGLLH